MWITVLEFDYFRIKTLPFFCSVERCVIKWENLWHILFYQLGNRASYPFPDSPIFPLIFILLLSWPSAIWTLYPGLSQLDPPSTLRFTYSKTKEKTDSFDKWAPFSCSHGEVYPHLSQHLTPGREGVSAKTRGHHLSHCELEPTWTPIECGGQQETAPGWF